MISQTDRNAMALATALIGTSVVHEEAAGTIVGTLTHVYVAGFGEDVWPSCNIEVDGDNFLLGGDVHAVRPNVDGLAAGWVK